MAAIVTSDIHLTDNPRDAYRWDLLPWLRKQVEKLGKDRSHQVFILGDLTDAKDRHSAPLVNRFVSQLHALAEVVSVYILCANHDSLDPAWPFFGFVNELAGVTFIREPLYQSFSFGSCLFVPFSKTFEKDMQEQGYLKPEFLNKARFVFTHQTYAGARSENGQEMRGVSPSIFSSYQGTVISGDIHVPQAVTRNVCYVGAPYRVRFGDAFSPRLIKIVDNGSMEDMRFPCPSKHLLEVSSVEDMERIAKKHGVVVKDFVKLRVSLQRTDYPDWQRIRGELRGFAEKAGWSLQGIQLTPMPTVRNTVTPRKAAGTPEEVVSDWGRSQRLAKDVTAVGARIIAAARKDLT